MIGVREGIGEDRATTAPAMQPHHATEDADRIEQLLARRVAVAARIAAQLRQDKRRLVISFLYNGGGERFPSVVLRGSDAKVPAIAQRPDPIVVQVGDTEIERLIAVFAHTGFLNRTEFSRDKFVPTPRQPYYQVVITNGADAPYYEMQPFEQPLIDLLSLSAACLDDRQDVQSVPSLKAAAAAVREVRDTRVYGREK